jgi:hypothetical protein
MLEPGPPWPPVPLAMPPPPPPAAVLPLTLLDRGRGHGCGVRDLGALAPAGISGAVLLAKTVAVRVRVVTVCRSAAVSGLLAASLVERLRGLPAGTLT